MNRLWERLLTLLYPHKCFCCGDLVPDAVYLCAACEQALPLASDCCANCGKPQSECICSRLSDHITRAAAPLFYQDGVRHGIHAFKYEGRSYYAQFLAQLMADCVKERFCDVSFDLITYVPLHRRKKRQRGYCQTELLAQALAKRLGVPVVGGLLRHTGKGHTQMQLHQIQARKENATLSFAIQKEVSLTGKRILLVDDVLTTGSTTASCAALLKTLGAAEIFVVTAATVVRQKIAKSDKVVYNGQQKKSSEREL